MLPKLVLHTTAIFGAYFPCMEWHHDMMLCLVHCTATLDSTPTATTALRGHLFTSFSTLYTKEGMEGGLNLVLEPLLSLRPSLSRGLWVAGILAPTTLLPAASGGRGLFSLSPPLSPSLFCLATSATAASSSNTRTLHMEQTEMGAISLIRCHRQQQLAGRQAAGPQSPLLLCVFPSFTT